MTDYKSIADRLVERGIGESFCTHGTFRLRINDSDLLTDKEFCHDWRVAGACMERHGNMFFRTRDGAFNGVLENEYWLVGDLDRDIDVRNESLPLAIILAYLEATK